jgi:outer membrane protein insertion porin family
MRSQQRLMNTRFFKDVKIDVEPGSAEGLMNLIFSMQEDRTGLFTLGAGYGTVSGFTFYQQLSENNFLGRGLRIYERIEFGQKKKSVQLGIDTPYLIKYDPTSLGFTISYNNALYEDISENYIDTNASAPMKGDDPYQFTRNSFEIQLRGGRALGEYWRVSGSYTWAWIESKDPNFELKELGDIGYDEYKDAIDDLADAFAQGFKTKSSFRFGLIFDTRDYVGGPSRGIYWSQFMAYTGGILGGDSQHIMTDTKFSFFIPLMWNFVFAVDTNFEFIFNQFNGDSYIYPGDKLSVDGMTEMRGWQNFNETGRSKATACIELRYPIEKTMLWGVFFYDVGMVWDGYKDMNFNFSTYKHSIGFGFRLQLAMLPIRLYFARRFHYPDGEIEWVGGTKFFKGWETVFSVAGIF